ncbi:hypothetical protein CDD80_1676 [Ophiocordyceps camponoti-rufipedis]|uniref:Uncharacterized protein n=1 Tax=Ophiocordyceps camponoti-rufipedis TaxID=2004952 RepID=A0A2C5ZAR3_9HYPO|nr:hypothetical protein CDD80_1676 [Ophiocordyceps camponoti-rufipedis]
MAPRQRPRLVHLPRRHLSSILLTLALLALVCVVLLASAVPSSPPELVAAAADGSLSVLFHQMTSHTPDPHHQPNHQLTADSWRTDAHWLSTPLSGDQQPLLPPLLQRRPVYCYYDATSDSSDDDRQAQRRLLLTWRRAWWAHGFHPVVLGIAEAKKNPRYSSLRSLGLSPSAIKDLTRWLAWESVDGGILTRRTLLPTLPDDPTLFSLARGELPSLRRWQGLDDALLVGQKESITAAIDYVMERPKSELVGSDLLDSLPGDMIGTGNKPAGLAWYSRTVLESNYRTVAGAFAQSRVHGLRSLDSLINTHLHVSWQNRYADGIDALKPYPEHTTAMISGALELAHRLASCSESPMPSSCPPNHRDCAPCVATAPMRVSTPARYRNSSHVFSIGTVPHPWTLALLHNQRSSLNISWIRRESFRDPWLATVTRALLGSGVSGHRRVMSLKEAAAGQGAMTNSFWLAAEDQMPNDLNWHFGFVVPEHGMDDGRSQSPVPAQRLLHLQQQIEAQRRRNGPVTSDEDVVRKEVPLLERAKQVVLQNKPTYETGLRASLEAWNMADTEAWRFVRAIHARRLTELETVQREEEAKAKEETGGAGRLPWSKWRIRLMKRVAL